MRYILYTSRLSLREFTENDTAFIVELVNTEPWLKYIGDRNIKTEQQAKEYLLNGPINSYAVNGYGLYLVELREDKTPIGTCGIINRDTLEHPDIGFALLPKYAGQGFGYEIAMQTLQYAKEYLHIHKVLAITIPENIASIKLLEKLGLQFEKIINSQSNESDLMLFST